MLQQEFYGWSIYRKAIKTFLKQRKKSKYLVKVGKYHDLELMEGVLDTNASLYMLDTISLPSQSGHDMILLTTKHELNLFEKDLALQLKDYCSMDKVDNGNDIQTYVTMYELLLDEYQIPLQTIGYYPHELEEMYGSEEDDTRAYLDAVYDDISSLDYDTKLSMMLAKAPLRNQYLSSGLLSKIIYSAEAFIKVMRDRM
jgi:hypothetical protein